jgi:hypothetical protein
LQARAAADGGAGRRGDREPGLDLGHPLDRGGAGGLRGVQGGGDPAFARGRGAVRHARHPGEHGGAGADAHADGGARLAGQRAGGDVGAILAQRLARIPLGFAGDGRDTAAAVLFLASDEARFVTGTELVVDGGMSVRCG